MRASGCTERSERPTKSRGRNGRRGRWRGRPVLANTGALAEQFVVAFLTRVAVRQTSTRRCILLILEVDLEQARVRSRRTEPLNCLAAMLRVVASKRARAVAVASAADGWASCANKKVSARTTTHTKTHQQWERRRTCRRRNTCTTPRSPPAIDSMMNTRLLGPCLRPAELPRNTSKPTNP